MSYSKYALLAYSTAFIWTLLYFAIGKYFGSNINIIENLLNTNKFLLITIFLFVCVAFMFKEFLLDIRRRRIQK
ncbi:hypothetical protein SCACP_27740 [Sporomusa carbonis]